MMREYKVFTFGVYRWVVWLLYPVLITLVGIGIQNGMYGLIPSVDVSFASFAPLMLCFIIPLAEVLQDFFVFGGVHQKAAAHFVCLKSAEKGNQVYRAALIMDQLRRMLLVLAVFGVNLCYNLSCSDWSWSAETVSYYLNCALWTLMVSGIGIFVQRFCRQFVTAMAVAMGTSCFLFIWLFLISGNVIMTILPGVLWLAVSAGTVAFALRKLERSYYD